MNSLVSLVIMRNALSYKSKKKDWKMMIPRPFSFILHHNPELVHPRDECETGFFEENLTGAVDIAETKGNST